MTGETLVDILAEKGRACEAWLARCEVQWRLEEITVGAVAGTLDGAGPNRLLTLVKGEYGFVVRFGAAPGWDRGPDAASLMAGLWWLYPILEPDGWDTDFEQNVAHWTAGLHAFLAGVDQDGQIKAGILALHELDTGERATEEAALAYLLTGRWPDDETATKEDHNA